MSIRRVKMARIGPNRSLRAAIPMRSRASLGASFRQPRAPTETPTDGGAFVGREAHGYVKADAGEGMNGGETTMESDAVPEAQCSACFDRFDAVGNMAVQASRFEAALGRRSHPKPNDADAFERDERAGIASRWSLRFRIAASGERESRGLAPTAFSFPPVRWPVLLLSKPPTRRLTAHSTRLSSALFSKPPARRRTKSLSTTDVMTCLGALRWALSSPLGKYSRAGSAKSSRMEDGRGHG